MILRKQDQRKQTAGVIEQQSTAMPVALWGYTEPQHKALDKR